MPYARLYPEVREALDRDGVEAEYAYVGAEPTDYYDLLARLWREPGGFIIVEQDIVPWPGAIAQLATCSHDWCGFAYELSTGVGVPGMLGCTRFSGRLTAEHPGVIEAVAYLPAHGTPPRYWGRMDTRIKEVMEDREGLRFSLHWPVVAHLNPAQRFVGEYNCGRCGAAIPRSTWEASAPPWRCSRCGS